MRKVITPLVLAVCLLTGCGSETDDVPSGAAESDNWMSASPDELATALGCDLEPQAGNDSDFDCGPLLITDWEGEFSERSELASFIEEQLAEGLAEDAIVFNEVTIAGTETDVARARDTLGISD